MTQVVSRNDLRIDQCLRQSDPRAAWRDLCVRIALPTIEKTVRSRVKNDFGDNDSRDEEASQATTEAFASVFQQFDSLANGKTIENLEAYAATAADRAFGKVLRRKNPARTVLANEIDQNLTSDPRLDKWTAGERTKVTGLSSWRDRPPVNNSRSSVMSHATGQAVTDCYGHRDPASMLMPDALLTLYRWLEGPALFNPVVSFFQVALRRTEMDASSSFDDGTTLEPVAPGRPDEGAAVKEILQALWDELAELEPSRRGVFLVFEPPGSEQDHLLDLLVAHGIADLDEIADFVGLKAEALIQILMQDRVELKDVAALYDMETKRAEGVRKGVVERLARRFEKLGFYTVFNRMANQEAP